jgi:outer membrane protein insertion porin family
MAIAVAVVCCRTVVCAQEEGMGLPLRAIHFVADAWIDEDGLRALLPLQIGAPLTTDDLAGAEQRLERTGIFRSIEVRTRAEDGAAIVLFDVKRKRIITDVSVVGYDVLKWRDAYRLARLRSGAFYDPEGVDAARQRLMRRYAQLGYPHAEVRSDVRLRPGEADVLLTIDEGKPEMVSAVVVTGAHGTADTGVPPVELVKAARSLVRKPHRRNAAHDGERLLLTRLRHDGFYGAQIDSEWVSSGDDTGVLWFTVDPGVKSAVVIEGNHARSDAQLLGLMDLDTRLIITDGTWRELARRMTRAYQDRGYYRVQVRLRVDDGPPRRIVFSIDEGRRYRVRRVDFAGNREMPADRLRAEMNIQPARWLPWPRSGAFVRSVFDEDLRRLWYFYREQGFADAEIVDAPVDIDDATGAIDVTVVIDEGPRTIVETVEAPDLAVLPTDVPTPKLAVAVGEPLRPAALDADKRAITAALRSGGYVDASVEPVVARRNAGETAPAAVGWKIDRGVQHTIGAVIVQGNVETRDATILRELPFERGDPLDPDALRRGQDQIYQLGTYRSVSVQPINPTDPVEDIGVEVVPRPPGSLQWGGGYNTRDGITGFAELTYDNLGHRARRITLRAQGSVVPDDPSSTQFLSLIGYRQPRFLGTAWQWNTELLGVRSTKTIDQYDILLATLGNGVVRELLPGLKFGTEMTLERADVFDVKPQAFVDTDSGIQYTTALSPSLTYDARNDPFAPTSGYFESARLRYAPGGVSSVHFAKLNMQHSQAFPLADWLSFIYTARLGYGYAFSGAPVLPIRERYFLGGSTTVRGFAENSLGPVWCTPTGKACGGNGIVTGGDLAMVLSLEWRVPIIYQLSAAVFNDNGGLFLTQCDESCRQQRNVQNDAFTWKNIRHSVGPGLRYMTPVGPISLDYGFKLQRRSFESIGEVHFSISGTF